MGQVPGDFYDAHVMYETGAHPSLDELDRMPVGRLDTYLMYKNVRAVIEFGGSYKP